MISGIIYSGDILTGVISDGGVSPSPTPARVGDHFVGVLSNSPSPIVLTSTVKSYTIEEK